MPNPFAKKVDLRMVADLGLPVLLDRFGGSIVVGQGDLDAVARKYGGAVGIKVEQVEPFKSYRLSLVPADPKEAPLQPPVSSPHQLTNWQAGRCPKSPTSRGSTRRGFLQRSPRDRPRSKPRREVVGNGATRRNGLNAPSQVKFRRRLALSQERRKQRKQREATDQK